MRRWLVRFGWTVGAVALVALLVWLLWIPAPGDRSTFAALSIEAYDPGELPSPAFADSDRASLASLAWRRQLDLTDPLRATSRLREWSEEADTFVLYVSAHVAERPLTKDGAQVCLLAPDFRRADLEQLLTAQDASAAVDLRDVLESLATIKAEAKVLLIDAPRSHAEPWLAVLAGDWTETLAADVKAAADDQTWVVVASGPEGISRTDHFAKRSQFTWAVGEVLEGKHDADGDGQIDVADLKQFVTNVTGQAPLVLRGNVASADDVLLERPLKRLGQSSVAAPSPPAKEEKPQDGKEVKAPPADPILLAWQAHDALLDADQTLKSSIGPADYAPDLWRTLQSILVWHDWSLHTGGKAPTKSLFEELSAAQPLLAFDAAGKGAEPTHAALAPFLAAIDRFASQQGAWKQAPPGYRFAVRRRNLLLLRVPEYWRWKAACGAFDEAQLQADIETLRALNESITRVGQAGDRAEAAELEALAKRNPAEELFRRVTTGIADDVTPLVERRAARGKSATLDAATQFAIEQLLLTALPSAADRDRLWKSLQTSEVEPGAMTRGDEAVVAQAVLEANLVKFQSQLAAPLTLAEGEKLSELSGAVEAAASQLAASDAAGQLAFAQRLAEYQSLLADTAPFNPTNPAGEVFVRFADALVERAPQSVTLAPLPTWLTKLEVLVDHPQLDLGTTAAGAVTVTIRADGEGSVPVLRLDEIPAPLRVEHAGKPLAAGVPLTGTRFELNVSVPRGVKAAEQLELRGTALVESNGQNETEPVTIRVALPADSQFELVSLGQTELVRSVGDGQAGLALLAFPQRLTSFALGVKQNSGAQGALRGALYELGQPEVGETLPATIEELERRGRRLDVQVEIAPPGDVRPIKFLPPAAPAPAPAPTPDAAAPAAPPTVEVEPPLLPSKYLAVVLDELDGETVVRQHLQWLEIEPLHPDRFVATPAPRIVNSLGQRKIEVPLQAKSVVEGTVAIPDAGVPFAVAGSAAFEDVDMAQASGMLTRNRPLTPKLNVPDADVDSTDAQLFLAVSGYPRAFMWNVDAEGGVIEPFRGSRIHIHSPVEAPLGEPKLSIHPDQPLIVDLEVDSENQDCAVELELRLLEGDRDPGEFSLEQGAYSVIETLKWRGTRQVRNRLKLDAKTGALGILSDVGDFEFTLPPSGSQGHAELYARILDGDGQSAALAEDRVRFVFDGTPPDVEGLAPDYDRTLEHVTGKPLAFRVRVTDRLSGPKSLLFWQDREPRNTGGAVDPLGIEAKLEPILSDELGLTEREFTVLLEKVPDAPPNRAGTLRMFFGATDNAGNAFEDLRRIDVRYFTQAMTEPGADQGKPRDVVVKVDYKRGNGTQISRGAEVELVAAGETPGQKKKVGPDGTATFEKLKPGSYQFKASGNMANMPGVGETTVVVPPEGDGPISTTITLASPPPPPPKGNP